MALVIPDSVELQTLQMLTTSALTMRLYGNDVTPAGTDTAAKYIEIAGGGYAAKPLTSAHWSITTGDPSSAVYDTTQSWAFTGVINAPGSVYGYFVTRDSDGKLMWAERFATGLVPFVPENGSNIRVLPRLSCQSEF